MKEKGQPAARFGSALSSRYCGTGFRACKGPPAPTSRAEDEGCVGLSGPRKGGLGGILGSRRSPRGKKYSGVVWETRIKETWRQRAGQGDQLFLLVRSRLGPWSAPRFPRSGLSGARGGAGMRCLWAAWGSLSWPFSTVLCPASWSSQGQRTNLTLAQNEIFFFFNTSKPGLLNPVPHQWRAWKRGRHAPVK